MIVIALLLFLEVPWVGLPQCVIVVLLIILTCFFAQFLLEGTYCKKIFRYKPYRQNLSILTFKPLSNLLSQAIVGIYEGHSISNQPSSLGFSLCKTNETF